MRKYTSNCCMLMILSILFVIPGCEKNDELTDITNQVEFLEPNFFGTCFSGFFDEGYSEVVIKDEASYQEFGDSVRIHPFNLNCDTAVLPSIDFSKYSLIGKLTSVGGCNAYSVRQVFRDENGKEIVYKIHVEYSGSCDMLIVSMNWALVPKIPKGFTVEFCVD
ncbi:MAG: hypothetical protein JXB00_10540 [Bacteroidales bacterium]|nr:hypothetical protein [Bacteroidales bacterium]